MSLDLDDEMAMSTTEQLLQSSLSLILQEVHNGRISNAYCEGCGNEIPEARRLAVPGVALCVGCQEVEEHLTKVGIRRGK
ncbi:TraR/DksA C4-type zinc finger protein [Pectobacterium sp. B2J-2]|uniref:TraR/DksA C4-type zinc finger protein n=1 Tax=Pectobacterium sp. B2J-2 TaxID=3385372 RepID=UPI0038FC4FE8